MPTAFRIYPDTEPHNAAPKQFWRALLLVLSISAAFFGGLNDTWAQERCRVADPTGTPLNVRTSPDGKIVLTLKNEVLVTVLDHSSNYGKDWVYVGDAERVPLGWVFRDYLDCNRNARETPLSPTNLTSTSSHIIVQLKNDGGIFVVPVEINSAITLDFIIDSGASDVSVPADVVSTLIRTGTIQDTDFIGTQTYTLADGSEAPSDVFIIRSLKVGNHIIENVRGRIGSAQGSLLLGQSFLHNFKSWSIDNTKHELILE